MKKHDKIKKKK